MRSLALWLSVLALAACGADLSESKHVPEKDAQSDLLAAEVASTCAEAAPCDDGDPCTLEDRCHEGACAGKAKDCDDGSPCSKDVCDPVHGCQWLPVAATCSDDGNPCTVNEHCVGTECKADAKNCDDNNPCTNESCDAKTGACGHVSNGQEHCVPRFTLTSPPHGLQLAGTDGQVLVAGQVHSDAGAIAQVTIAGAVTAVDASGAFALTVPLQCGPNVLTLQATDANQGQGHAMRAVVWSPQWSPLQATGAQVPNAGLLRWGAQAAALAVQAQELNVAKLFNQGAVKLAWAPTVTSQSGSPDATQLDLALQVTPTNVKLPGNLGVPLLASCQPVPKLAPLTNPQAQQAWVTFDALNALLWAMWLGGWYELDASSLLFDTDYALLQIVVGMHALVPPLIVEGPGPAATLHVQELRFDMDIPLGDKVVHAQVWASFRAKVVFGIQGGQLRLTFADIEDLQTEVATTYADTDLHVTVEKVARQLAITKLVTLWREAGLVAVPVGLAGDVTVVSGGVLVGLL